MLRNILFCFFACFIAMFPAKPAWADENEYSLTDRFIQESIEKKRKVKAEYYHDVKDGIDRNLKEYPAELRTLVYALNCGDFHTASKTKDVIVKRGIDLNIKSTTGVPILLIYGVDFESEFIGKQLKWLDDNGVDFDVLIHYGTTSSRHEDGTVYDVQIYKTFIESAISNYDACAVLCNLHPSLSSKINSTTGKTPLHTVATIYEKGQIELFIAFNANINALDNEGHTPIIKAVLAKNYRNALVLLSYGANPDIPFKTYTLKKDDNSSKYIPVPHEFQSILDFLKNSPSSQKEETSTKSSSKNNAKIRIDANTVRTNAKKYLISLLEIMKKSPKP